MELKGVKGVDADFHMLEKTYRGMNIETFIRFFLGDGRNLNAANPDGKTLLQLVSQHRLGEDYADVLKANGAG